MKMNKIKNALFWILFWLALLAACVFSGAVIGLVTGWPNMANCGMAIWFLLLGTAVTCAEDTVMDSLKSFVCRLLRRA